MSTKTRLRAPLAAVLLLLAMLTGCVEVPIAGPIEKIEG